MNGWRLFLKRNIQAISRHGFALIGITKKVVIHNHLFKNAGTTIDWALAKNFQENFIDHRDDEKMMQGANYVRSYLKANPDIRALSTHHLQLPLPKMFGVNFFTIMMFRHPIERVSSVYKFERRQTDSDAIGARFARDHSLREYVAWRMKHDVPPTIRNFHVYKSQSPSVDWRKEMDKGNLVRSKAYVDGAALLGFVEFFDESMVLFEKKLSRYFPLIDLSYVKQNIGQTNKEPLEIRIKKIRDEVGDEIYSLLFKKNTLDLKLYEHAKKNFLRRLSKFNDLDKELDEFRSRCLCLHEATAIVVDN